jgi:tetratricopeptide (TPR) repeat protein
VQALALVVLTFAAYASAFGNGFVSDDLSSIVLGRAVGSLRNLLQVFLHDAMWNSVGDVWARSTAVDTYRPIPIASFLLEHAVYGLRATGYHLDSVLVHAVNVLLVWALGRRLGLGPGPSVLAAALFATHPSICEAVHWINGRSDPLMLLFSLLAILLWLPWIDGAKPAVGRAVAIAVLAFFATLSKETAFILLPVLAVGLAWGRVPWRRLLRLILPGAGGLLAGFVLRNLVLGRLATGSGSQLGYAAVRVPLIWRDGLTSLFVPAARLRASLASRYREVGLGRWLLALLLVALVVALAVLAWRRRYRLLAPFVACLLALLAPVAILTSLSGWSGWGRYLYPVAPMAVFAALEATRRWPGPRRLVGAVLVAVFAIQTFAAGADFRSERSYGMALIEQDPACAEGYLQVGALDAYEDHPAQAIPHLERGLALEPKSAAAWSSLAWSYLAVKRTDEAVTAARRTRQLDAGNKMARFVEVSVLVQQGRQLEAADLLLPLLAADAGSEGLWKTLAGALAGFGTHSVFATAIAKAGEDPRYAKLEQRLHQLLDQVARQ